MTPAAADYTTRLVEVAKTTPSGYGVPMAGANTER